MSEFENVFHFYILPAGFKHTSIILEWLTLQIRIGLRAYGFKFCIDVPLLTFPKKVILM